LSIAVEKWRLHWGNANRYPLKNNQQQMSKRILMFEIQKRLPPKFLLNEETKPVDSSITQQEKEDINIIEAKQSILRYRLQKYDLKTVLKPSPLVKIELTMDILIVLVFYSKIFHINFTVQSFPLFEMSFGKLRHHADVYSRR
jgi:hypothetical protein